MGVQRAVGPDESGFGGGQLAAAVHHLANGPHALHFGGEGLDEFDAQVGRGVTAPWRHQGVHGTTQGRVEQGGKPAAVHRTQRVHVVQAWGTLKNGLACADLDEHKVECFGDAGVGQFAAEQALHDLQAGFACHLILACHAGTSTCIQPLADFFFLGQPSLK